MDKRELLRHVGAPAQLLGVREYRLCGGKREGVRVADLYNATGASLSLLPDRGMDIERLSLGGVNLGFLSKTSVTHPAYFAEDGARGFFRSFYAGFLTACGFTYMGGACQDEGEHLGLHGLSSNIPAETFCADTLWNSGAQPMVQAKGRVRQARVFGENITMSREVQLCGEENKFTLTDHFENEGFAKTPFMLLYHMNFGYPFLEPGCRLLLPSQAVSPRDADADAGLAQHLSIEPPQDGYREQVFFHQMRKDAAGNATLMLHNPRLELAVQVSYPTSPLTSFTQWKSMASGEYVLGLEPGNCHVMGRATAKNDGSMKFLQSGEVQIIQLEITLLSSNSTIEAACRKLQL